MEDSPLKGCLYALLGFAAISGVMWLLVRDEPPPRGPSCYEVAQRAVKRGATAAEERFLERCERDIREDEAINRR